MRDDTTWDTMCVFDAAGVLDLDYAYENIPFSEVEAGRMIVRSLDGALTYAPLEKQWRRWDGRVHYEIETEEASQIIDMFADMMRAAVDLVEEQCAQEVAALTGQAQKDRQKELRLKFKNHKDFVKRLFSDGGQRAVLRQLQYKCTVDGAQFDVETRYFVVENGVIDLEQAKRDGFVTLLEHDQTRLLTKASDVTWDPAAVCPSWNAYLESSIPDTEVTKYLQMWAGSTLLGDPQDKGLVNLIGPPDSGKSLFINTMLNVFGTYGGTVRPETFLVKPTGDQSFDVHELKGLRYAATTEPDNARGIDSGIVKQLTGGDPIRSRTLNQRYGKPWIPQCTIFIASNAPMKMDTRDSALLQRIKPVTFPIHFYRDDDELHLPKADLGLKKKLARELPGILNWVLAGLLAYVASGFQREPETVSRDRERLAIELEAPLQWVHDMVEAEDAPLAIDKEAPALYCVSVEIAYSQYRDWCAQTGEYVMKRKTFIEILDRLYPKSTSQGVRFRGLKILNRGWQRAGCPIEADRT